MKADTAKLLRDTGKWMRARWSRTGERATWDQLDDLRQTNTGLNWSATQQTADQALRSSAWQYRDKSRYLARFNPYGKRFFSELGANVLGAKGMALQMQILQEIEVRLAGGEIIPAGAPDVGANLAIEDAFYAFWNSNGQCDVTGAISGPEFDRLWLKSIACDGDCLVRIVRGFENEWKFALQLIRADQLETNYNEVLKNGHEVRMSVELDKWGRRVAYHVAPYHAGDWQLTSSFGGSTTRGRSDRVRIPAAECLFFFPSDEIGQTRGWPWLTSVIDKIHGIDKMDEAELVACRAAAEKLGFFTQTQDAEGKPYEGLPDSTRAINIDSAPGSYHQLPVGWDFKGWDPKHPNADYGAYIKTALRGVAAGIDMAYGTLANDRSDSSFSAERTSVMDERELYQVVQEFFAVQGKKPVFSAWLKMALLGKKVKLKNGSVLPIDKSEKFDKPFFQGRRWGWLNPQQDVNANILAVQHGFKSRRQVIAEAGDYVEDVFREQQADDQLAKLYGISPGSAPAPKAPDSPYPDSADDDEPPSKKPEPKAKKKPAAADA